MASLFAGEGIKQGIRQRAKAVRGKPGQPPFKGSKQFTGIDPATGRGNQDVTRRPGNRRLGTIRTPLAAR